MTFYRFTLKYLVTVGDADRKGRFRLETEAAVGIVSGNFSFVKHKSI